MERALTRTRDEHSKTLATRPPATTDPAVQRPVRERDAAEQAMLMREVDDAVRQDQVGTVARRYGIAIIAALVLLLAAFGGWLLWRNFEDNRLEERSEELVLAIDEAEAGSIGVAEQELAALADDAPAAQQTIARLLRAGIAAQQARTGEALALYDEVAADEDAPGPYRDFAAIRAVMSDYDAIAPQQVIDRLGPLAVPGNAWYGSAGELVALAYLQLGREEEAGPLLAAIARDASVPQSLRARTRQLAGLLGYDAIEDVDVALAGLAAQGSAVRAGASLPANGE